MLSLTMKSPNRFGCTNFQDPAACQTSTPAPIGHAAKDWFDLSRVFKKLMLRMTWMLKRVWKGHVKRKKKFGLRRPTFQNSMQVPISVSTVVPKHVCTHLEPRLTGKTKPCRQNVSMNCMFLPRLWQV